MDVFFISFLNFSNRDSFLLTYQLIQLHNLIPSLVIMSCLLLSIFLNNNMIHLHIVLEKIYLIMIEPNNLAPAIWGELEQGGTDIQSRKEKKKAAWFLNTYVLCFS